MLPPNTSEFDTKTGVENHDTPVHFVQPVQEGHEHGPVADSDEFHTDAEFDDDGEGLEHEAAEKQKKKGIGKGTIIAAACSVVVVALCGVAYFMQSSLQKPAPISRKIVIDPSLMETKPALNAPAASIGGTEVTPNLSARDATPLGSFPTGSSGISTPPSDPFSGAATSPTPVAVVAPIVPTSTPVVVVAVPASIPTVIIAPAPVANADGPRVDPFGAVVIKSAPKIEKPAAESVVKADKPIKVVKVKPVVVDIEEVETIKPRAVKKVVAKKRPTVRRNINSEPRPSKERAQPQNNENFSGYEKLF